MGVEHVNMQHAGVQAGSRMHCPARCIGRPLQQFHRVGRTLHHGSMPTSCVWACIHARPGSARRLMPWQHARPPECGSAHPAVAAAPGAPRPLRPAPLSAASSAARPQAKHRPHKAHSHTSLAGVECMHACMHGMKCSNIDWLARRKLVHAAAWPYFHSACCRLRLGPRRVWGGSPHHGMQLPGAAPGPSHPAPGCGAPWRPAAATATARPVARAGKQAQRATSGPVSF